MNARHLDTLSFAARLLTFFFGAMTVVQAVAGCDEFYDAIRGGASSSRPVRSHQRLAFGSASAVNELLAAAGIRPKHLFCANPSTDGTAKTATRAVSCKATLTEDEVRSLQRRFGLTLSPLRSVAHPLVGSCRQQLGVNDPRSATSGNRQFLLLRGVNRLVTNGFRDIEVYYAPQRHTACIEAASPWSS